MPIFEYRCRKCGRRFEAIVRNGAAPQCPSCGGARLEKLLSTFAVAGGGEGGAHGSAWEGGSAGRTDASFGGCGTCGDPRGPGSCSLDE